MTMNVGYSFVTKSFSSLMLILLLVISGTHAYAEPSSRSVAITIDDLPFAEQDVAKRTPEAAIKASEDLIDALRKYEAPATGFVNEDQIAALGDTAMTILMRWTEGGFDLGHHGYSHADFNKVSVAEMEEEIAKGERIIRPLAESAGRPVRFFRFPYNHLGSTDERQSEIERILAARGYRIAASTIDTSDYLFAQAYSKALNEQDETIMKRVQQEYLAYTREKIIYFADLNAKALGYEPPAIFLIHQNLLNASVMDSILALFQSLNYKFVSLAEAQSDPAYERLPKVPTNFGPMWGYRWARERGVRVDGSLDKEPPAWLVAYSRGDNAGSNSEGAPPAPAQSNIPAPLPGAAGLRRSADPAVVLVPMAHR